MTRLSGEAVEATWVPSAACEACEDPGAVSRNVEPEKIESRKRVILQKQ